MLRVVGEEAVEDEYRSFWGDGKTGMEDADVPRGGLLALAVAGRCGNAEAALSFSRTFSARDTIQLAMDSNTSVTLTMARVARNPSRPAMAMSA